MTELRTGCCVDASCRSDDPGTVPDVSLRHRILAVTSRFAGIALGAILGTSALSGDDASEFFEKRVRPVLANECWSCHGPDTQHGGLRLDSRQAAMRGGGRGPAIVPGDPEASLLVRALRHDGLQMPLGGRLDGAKVADIAKWIEGGAAWRPDLPAEVPEDSIEERAGGHWAFRPVQNPNPPTVRDESWGSNEIDAFVLAKLEAEGLSPASQSSRRRLIRRLAFDLTGLPPRPELVEAFVHSESPTAYADLVDRLIKSKRFGEHWARHWMDWVRYCESHGSQGDFELPMAWRYRDYLIRAFNQDVAYDQMLREYLAGDLLENPRVDEIEGVNESMLGLGNLRMVEYGYLPVDALDDQVKVVDNQIDVLSKAFQGLTVSCARCHDHKFDPIKQKDFYAIYGILASSRPGLVTIDSPAVLATGRDRLERLRQEIRSQLASTWVQGEGALATLLSQARAEPESESAPQSDSDDGKEPSPRLQALMTTLASDDLPDDDPLQVWQELRIPGSGRQFIERWQDVVRKWQNKSEEAREFNEATFRSAWDLSEASHSLAWFPTGPGVPNEPTRVGEYRVEPDGDRIITGLLPAGVHTGLDSQKFGGILGSPRFRVASDYISLRVSGSNFASARLIVENYPIGNGGIHPAKELAGGRTAWVRLGTAYRKGQTGHIELQTLDDRSKPFRDDKRKPDRVARRDGRSSFGISEVVFHDTEEAPRPEYEAILHLLDGEPPETLLELEERYDMLARASARAWFSGTLDTRQAAYLDAMIRTGLLTSSLVELEGLRPLVEEYRLAETDAPVPQRAPGVLPGTSFDQPLFVNGDHRRPAEPVERGFLEFLGGKPFHTQGSGRLQLAEAIANEQNPLTSRVLVNRLWHYLFGTGIVSTVDNFGLTGDRPSHPALLDFLATRFVEGGWSIKDMIRYIVLSSTYRMGTESAPESRDRDPENRLLQHQNARRLPAESIRDAILETSGDLDPSMYGPSINVYYVGKTEGGGTKGPLDGARRRSVYQAVKRNAQNPFLEVFDAPKPSTARGRRDSTNIPAQSLAMLNDPFVVGQAARWANRTLADGAISPRDRAVRMFRRAIGRSPDAEEVDLLMTSLGTFAEEHALSSAEWLGSESLWKDFAQSLFNLKQFIYLR